MTRVGSDSPRSGRPYVSLRGRIAFTRAYRSPRRHRAGGVVVIIDEGGSGPPRVGFVAGRRIGNAVARNRVKRRLREAMSQVALDDGKTYVVIALEDAVEATVGRLTMWLGAAVVAARYEPEETD